MVFHNQDALCILNMLPILIFISVGRDCTRGYWYHVFLLYRFCRNLLTSELFLGEDNLYAGAFILYAFYADLSFMNTYQFPH